MSDRKGLDAYNKQPSAMPLIIAVTMLCVGLVATGVWYQVSPLSDFGLQFPLRSIDEADRLIFLFYFCGFIAVWVVYFGSRSSIQFLRVRTLRLLLHCTSLNWGTADERIKKRLADQPLLVGSGDIDDEQLTEIEVYFKDKARTSLQTLGMLIAVAALELGQINLMRHWASASEDRWHACTLGIATLSAIASFIMFVVATDSLDSLFNRFRGTVERHKLVDHFYRNSINLRYFGLVFLLLGAVMIVANLHPILGAISFGLVFFFGCPTWFPDVSEHTDVGTGRLITLQNSGWMLVILLPTILRYIIV